MFRVSGLRGWSLLVLNNLFKEMPLPVFFHFAVPTLQKPIVES